MGNNNRGVVVILIVILISIVFVIRLIFLQIVDPSYKYYAENNTQRKITEYPSRGLIYDRNNKLLVSNQPVYDIMIVPRDVVEFDTLEFCNYLDITIEECRNSFERVREGMRQRRVSSFKPSAFIKQISAKQYAIFQEKEYQFRGFFGQRRDVRKYEFPNAAHIFGYITEVDNQIIKNDPYYVLGDYSGINGVERIYEKYLRGEKGARYVMVDVVGREKQSFRDGKMDVSAIEGSDINLSIDIELQRYGEELMQEKIGSIVAIEPSTGEILAMVSAPSYDPSLLIGRDRSKYYPELSSNKYSPLLNRSIMSKYPPGSTFKVAMGLIGLQEDIMTTTTRFSCNYGFHARGLSVRCHAHSSPINLVPSIATSCNAYYCNIFKNMIDNPKYDSPSQALDLWRDYLLAFRLGVKTGVDLDSEDSGSIPNSDFYNNLYRGSWSGLTVISLAIGQGETLTTPIQMANMTAAIANKGKFYTPHLIKKIANHEIPERFNELNEVGIDSTYFNPIIDGMEQAVWGEVHTTARIARIPDVRVCGKTGTAQNPHGDDHSVFIAFAPKENPQIAIAVYVENGGFGASVAAPIASLMIEKYLKEEIHPSRRWIEQRMLNLKLIEDETVQ